MITPRQQAGTGGGADRCGMESVVADAFSRNFVQCWRVSETAERFCRAEAAIVHEDNDDVGCVFRKPVWDDPPFLNGILQAWIGKTG